MAFGEGEIVWRMRKRYLLGVVIALCLICMFFFSEGPARIPRWGAAWRSGVQPVFHGKTSEKVVALTFDVRESAQNVENILQVLTDYRVAATFFVSGEWVGQNPELARQITRRGHSIGSLGYSACDLAGLPAAELNAELALGNKEIYEVTGIVPRFVRPVTGEYTVQVLSAIEQAGALPVLWNVDSLDTELKSSEQIWEKVTYSARRGDIIRFQADSTKTAHILPAILEELIQKGYGFATMDEIVASAVKVNR